MVDDAHPGPPCDAPPAAAPPVGEHHDQPPDDAAATRAPGHPPVPWGRRLVAWGIDALIAGLPITTCAVVFLVGLFLLMNSRAPTWLQQLPNVVSYVWLAVMMVAGTWCILYSLFRDGLGRGQSWGKGLCGLAVIRVEDRRPCSLGASAMRNLLGLAGVGATAIMPYCGFALALIEPVAILASPKGQRLGDRWAHTQVVDADR